MRGSTLFGTLLRNIGRTHFDPSAVFPLYTARSLHHPIARSAVPVNGTASEIHSKYSYYTMFRAFVKQIARGLPLLALHRQLQLDAVDAPCLFVARKHRFHRICERIRRNLRLVLFE